MVFVTTSGPSLCISPWKDGLRPREIVKHSHQNIRSVLVIFPENIPGNERNILSEWELIELFKVIANQMPSVRSITISGGSYQSQPASSRTKMDRGGRVVPPLKAITSLLRGNSGHLLALSLIQIRLLGTERDYRDFIYVIQKHRTLQSFDCTGCVFEKQVHADSLQESCQRKRLLHFMFDGGVVLEPPKVQEPEHYDDHIRFAGEESTVRSIATNTTDDSAWGSVVSYHNKFLCWCI